MARIDELLSAFGLGSLRPHAAPCHAPRTPCHVLTTDEAVDDIYFKLSTKSSSQPISSSTTLLPTCFPIEAFSTFSTQLCPTGPGRLQRIISQSTYHGFLW